MYLTPDDLAPFATIEAAKAAAMIADAEAMAGSVAPCLADATTPLTQAQIAAVRAVLRRAVLRWHDLGNGAVTQRTTGPFGETVDTSRNSPRGLFWPAEIADLQAVCRDIDEAPEVNKVFTVDTGAHRRRPRHTPWCDLMMGGAGCSCGSYLTRYEYPLYETGPL